MGYVTFGGIWTLALPVPLGIAIETNGDKIFDEEPGVSETLQVLLRRGSDLTLGRTNISNLTYKGDFIRVESVGK